MAIKFFGKTSVLTDVKDEIIFIFDPSIDCTMKNKKTSLGAVDIIAWNVLHTKLFQRLLRVDFVVPSYFVIFYWRNILLSP